MIILVFDTETTGLPSNRHAPPSDTSAWPYIVQLSWICYDTDVARIESTHDYLVRLPNGVSLPPESTAVHGITASQLRRKGVDPQQALSDFVYDLQRADRFVAHNLDFDQAVIQASCFRLDMLPPFELATCRALPYCTAKEGVVETLIWAQRKNGTKFLRYPKLWELHRSLFNTQAENLHDALADVLVCLRCYLEMAHGLDLMECRRARELFELYGVASNKRRKLSCNP